jgi:hypothetical protein
LLVPWLTPLIEDGASLDAPGIAAMSVWKQFVAAM